LYTQTPDHDFILDRLPDSGSGFRTAGAADDGDVVFASCCSGHGFKFGPMLGDLAASMALGNDDMLRERHPELVWGDAERAKFASGALA
jgi:glycine/D-amino acid oxidase-like deaminating enzyme